MYSKVKNRNNKNDIILLTTKNIGSYREKSEGEIIKTFEKILKNKYALKYLFYIRDYQNGLGEKRFFRVCLKYLAQNTNCISNKIVSMIPFYGRYDDLLCLFDTKSEKKALYFIKNQLEIDTNKMEKGEKISLLAKWLPSENASNETNKKYALKIARFLRLKPSQYRKMLSKMRKYIGIVETKMCANDWKSIDILKVPKYNALQNYTRAFMKHSVDMNKKYTMKTKKAPLGKRVYKTLNNYSYKNIPFVKVK